MERTGERRSRTGPPNRRPARGYPRGEDTRLRVITTAIAVFGRRGYERASTREIAAEAGVNPPALQYYFDSKAGLYYACVDRVSTMIVARLAPALARATAALQGEPALSQSIGVLCDLQDDIVDSIFTEDEGPSMWRLLAGPPDLKETLRARRLLLDRLNRPIFGAISGLIARVIGRPADDLQTGLHTFALIGQIAVFHLDETRIVEALGWTAPRDDEIALLKSILRSHTTILLTGLAAAG